MGKESCTPASPAAIRVHPELKEAGRPNTSSGLQRRRGLRISDLGLAGIPVSAKSAIPDLYAQASTFSMSEGACRIRHRVRRTIK